MNPPSTPRPPSAPKPVRGTQRVIIWAGLVLLFLAVWQFQEGDPSDTSKPHTYDAVSWMPNVVFGCVMIVMVVFFVRGRRLSKRLLAAVALVARDQVTQAESIFASLSNSKQLLVRAQALFWLAT